MCLFCTGTNMNYEAQQMGANSPLDALTWPASVSTNNIDIYFATEGENVDGFTTLGWTDTQIDQIMASLQDISDVTNLTFSVTTNLADAEFQFGTNNEPDAPYAGYMYLPGGSGVQDAIFNLGTASLDNIVKGSFAYNLVQHEVLHGLGLEHPHDGETVLSGVTNDQDLGDFNLNQGVYTIMSYVDGFPEAVTFPSLEWGAMGSPGALDIAVLQDKYGAGAHNTGNSLYTISDFEGVGTYFETIYDTGGVDTISYSGSLNAKISLVAATLDYSATGGGVVSYANGISGGFTIANGVVIEKAFGGSGNDSITGNSANNILKGNAGNDVINGGAGNDFIVGGTGADTANGGAGNDKIFAGQNDTGNDVFNGGSGNDIVGGGAGNDSINGGLGDDTLYGGDGDDALTGADGNDVIWSGSGEDMVQAGNGADIMGGGIGDDTIFAGGGSDTIYGAAGADTIYGGSENDIVFGGAGNDVLYGGASGNDIIYGGQGNDTIVFGANFGEDRVGGFNTLGDNILDISALNLSSFNALDISQSGNDTLIDTGSGTITLFNTEVATIGSEDFII